MEIFFDIILIVFISIILIVFIILGIFFLLEKPQKEKKKKKVLLHKPIVEKELTIVEILEKKKEKEIMEKKLTIVDILERKKTITYEQHKKNLLRKKWQMEFLPLLINREKVYAGFWSRLGASLIDIIIFIPIMYITYKLQKINIPIAIFIAILSSFLFPIYSIYFNFKYGGSPGKIAVEICVTKPNGTRIELKEAILRSSVDLVYGMLFAIYSVIAISKVDAAAYLSAGYADSPKLLMLLYPVFSRYTRFLSDIWYGSEMVVLLLNKRKRALHDYIAGTVVIFKKHSK